MSGNAGEFDIPFFRENGFIRKRCRFCNSYFWTQVEDIQSCGESPCEEYSFIGNPPTNKKYSLSELRRTFLHFFEENGHEVIKPYPVVARWRNDVYLTGASIFDFQPYVTEGIIPPPANPLVISQPCLRLTDIDNVGPTMGRHLTIFEMGGAHAFNSQEKEVYWKDQTVRYHHELLTEKLGVRSESVHYKEELWKGGGNAGPDLSASVAGLEISTLVFMLYKIVGESLVEMPIRTVDTGYGIERWTWLSQGSSNGFEPVYGPLLSKIAELAGVTLDTKLLEVVSRYSGIMGAGTSADRINNRKRIAGKLEMDSEELEHRLSPMENIFAVADHTKAISFILSEGVVPSNVREGYLVRLLIRRTYRLLKALGIDDGLQAIIDMQIAHWGKDFPTLQLMRDETFRVLSSEQQKYQRTTERGQELVKRLAGDLKTKGLRIMPTETLIEMYDSHGLVPELVKEIASKDGIEVEVPVDFYGLIVSKKTESPSTKESDLERIVKEKSIPLSETRPLYYDDQYMTKFKAKVLTSFENYFILDQTCFYAEGGGQPGDQGTVRTKAEQWSVIDSQKIGNTIVHITKDGAPKPGSEIEGEIQWERRIALTRHHSAAHILMGAIRRVLGAHAWQTGAQKNIHEARLDISHYQRISQEEIEKIEELANEIVLKNIPIETRCMSRDRAERMYGFRLYQGGVVPGREIRVVKTGDWEVEACGGTHCRNTGEVGMIKISHLDRIQDGVERVTFVAGLRSVNLFQEQEKTIRNIAELTGSSSAAVEKIRALLEENRSFRREIESWKRKSLAEEARAMLSTAKKIGGVRLITARKDSYSESDLITLAEDIAKLDNNSISVLLLVRDNVRLFISAGQDAIHAGIDSGKIAKELAAIVGGGGGGKPYFAQGGGTTVNRADQVLAKAEEIVKDVVM